MGRESRAEGYHRVLEETRSDMPGAEDVDVYSEYLHRIRVHKREKYQESEEK